MNISIGFSLQNHYTLPLADVIVLLRKAGFSAVSPVWTPELDLSTVVAVTKAQTMTIQSLHAPCHSISQLWNPQSIDAPRLKKAIFQSIDDCARFQVPILVLHGWGGFDYSFCSKSLYFDNFDQIIDHAASKGITVAFENLEGEEYLAALMARYRNNSTVGYCWDSGHDHCYPHKLDFLSEFGDRLVITHLTDNLGLRSSDGIPTGNDDLHFLPYDGNVFWDHAIEKLRHFPQLSILNFELKYTSHSKNPRDLIYTRMTLPQYLEAAGKRARLIAEKYFK